MPTNLLILLLVFAYKGIEVVPKEKKDEVLIKGPIEEGLFGGLVLKYTELANNDAWLLGFRGGLIAQHTFAIGGGFYGMMNEIVVSTHYPLKNYYMDFGYGGLILEFIIGSRKLVHLGILSLIGGGGVYYHDSYGHHWYDDAFLVLEPSTTLTLNVTKGFRLDLGISYRYLYGINLDGISDENMSGPSISTTLKFGRF